MWDVKHSLDILLTSLSGIVGLGDISVRSLLENFTWGMWDPTTEKNRSLVGVWDLWDVKHSLDIFLTSLSIFVRSLLEIFTLGMWDPTTEKKN